MIIVHWQGKAVNKNRRYRIAKVKGKYRLVKTDAYKNWTQDIGWAIKAQTLKRYKTLQSVMISATLDSASDHHNLVDVILDALEVCGLIVNDRDVGAVVSMPCSRHKRGESDEIWLFIQEGEEEKWS
jgi:Holliday junction resolvase RusA-like endonuclease